MYLLGLSCFYHDSAACLLKDGVPVAAASEQAFTRKKHDEEFPVHAIRYALRTAGIGMDQVDAVAFYDKPLVKFERIILSHIATFPKSFSQFVSGMPSWFSTKLRLDKLLDKEFAYAGPILYGRHHLSHAASAFYCSGWEEAAVLTVDGVGEWATASWGYGRGSQLHLTGEIRFPHSLGLLYSAFTYYLGFKVNSAEYKVMGLAPYGEPRYVDRIKELIHILPDGTFRLDMRNFTFDHGLRMYNQRFEEVMGEPTRPLETGELTQFHKDVARSLQAVVDEVMVRLATRVVEETGIPRLCLAGGVALNCVANGHILREAPIEDIFVQPAAGDAGGAMGAALWAWHDVLGKPRQWKLEDVYLGPGYDDVEVQQTLDRFGAVYTRLDRQPLLDETARLIDQGNVVGWYQDRMEWGPRALGHRSILGDARNPEMRDIINMKIKMREGFRPFAPTILEEHVARYFQLERPSPYMLLVAPVQPDKDLPAVTHVDGSARVQTISRQQDELYYDLIDTFRQQTGCPVVIN
ncbi:MAG: carbamoyltransferase N-terminal domain-containing protein, partial [Myxococcota bacterium]|nr:carbamoyltransferase N-terminal domain-containing protein [Myxococcota bacterium]